MNQKLLEQLAKISEEEKEILEGKNQISKSNYTSAKEFCVDSKKMLEMNQLITIRPHTRFICFPEHGHNYVEAVYMCSGHTTHIINGKERVELKEGDLLFLNQQVAHKIEKAESTDIGVNFIILPEFFDVAFGMIEKESSISNFIVNALRQKNSDSEYLYFQISDILPIQNLIENMIWLIKEPDAYNNKILQTTMGLLFMQLTQYGHRIVEQRNKQVEHMIAKMVLQYIETNYRTASLTEIADQANMSIYTMSRLIKDYTKSNFSELLQEKRFWQAKKLLLETNLPVADVIYAVGYENTAYFHRKFKERYKMTPKKYRTANKILNVQK